MSMKKDYLHIRAWGKMMQSNQSYIEDQVEEARADGAPQDAIYQDFGTKKWKIYSDVSNPDTRRAVDAILKVMGG
jgi:hypothetical protein